MATNKNVLTGTTYTVKDEAVAVSIERYNELIKKEVLLDQLMENKEVHMYLMEAKEVQDGI